MVFSIIVASRAIFGCNSALAHLLRAHTCLVSDRATGHTPCVRTAHPAAAGTHRLADGHHSPPQLIKYDQHRHHKV